MLRSAIDSVQQKFYVMHKTVRSF